MLDQAVLLKINQTVYERFPDCIEVVPKISQQNIQSKPSGSNSCTYLLIYQIQKMTSDQKKIHKYIRVVADEQGKILKLSTSH